MLPIHPQPKVDESLSSWMVRLAFGNGFPLKAFYEVVLGYPLPMWKTDIDADAAPELLARLSAVTEQPLSVLQKMTLVGQSSASFRREIVFGRIPWVLPVGLFHSGKTCVGMQFCPRCLATDEVPYFRMCWRKLLFAVCPIHHCVLEDRCSGCSEPVVYHFYGRIKYAAYSELADIVRCHRCGLDLSSVRAMDFPKAPPEMFLSIRSVAKLISDGLGEYPDNERREQFEVIRTWYQLLNILTGRNGKKIVRVLNDQADLSLPADILRTTVKVATVSTRIRLKILMGIAWLMDQWPSRLLLISEWRNSGLKSRLHKNDSMTSWFGDLLTQGV